MSNKIIRVYGGLAYVKLSKEESIKARKFRISKCNSDNFRIFFKRFEDYIKYEKKD